MGCESDTTNQPQTALGYEVAKEWCVIADNRITESSGLALANQVTDETYLWTHNDDSGKPRLYQIDHEGQTVQTVVVNGAEVVDCEDLVSFTLNKQSWLLLADVGDNLQNRNDYQLIVIPEPPLPKSDTNSDNLKSAKKKKKATGQKVDISVQKVIQLKYPHGSRECEAVAVDLSERLILFATKSKSNVTEIYSTTLPISADGKWQIEDDVAELKLVTTIQIPTIVGMCMSDDGQKLAMLGRANIFLFDRGSTKSDDKLVTWKEILEKNQPAVLKKPKQQQGEAICFNRDGKSLLITSEGKHQPVWELPHSK